MKTYGFDVILKGVSEISDEAADALIQAGYVMRPVNQR
jgi:hypothetical protein